MGKEKKIERGGLPQACLADGGWTNHPRGGSPVRNEGGIPEAAPHRHVTHETPIAGHKPNKTKLTWGRDGDRDGKVPGTKKRQGGEGGAGPGVKESLEGGGALGERLAGRALGGVVGLRPPRVEGRAQPTPSSRNLYVLETPKCRKTLKNINLAKLEEISKNGLNLVGPSVGVQL